MSKKLFFSVLALYALSANADSIYLCKAYGGGMFWSSAHCNQHNALIDRIVNVPNGLPWDQKVAIGEQQLRGVTVLTAPQPTQAAPVYSNKTECASLNARVDQLDAMARQPQSAATQDWIRAERARARDRQFQIHC